MRKYLERRLEQVKNAEEDGFTLIELLVVLLIIGILLGIAIPTYLALTGNANTTAAQSNLNNALTGAKSFFGSNGQSYTASNGGTVLGTTSIQGTSLTYTVAATTSASSSNTIDVVVPNATTVVLAAQATNGKCYAIVDEEAAPAAQLGTSNVGTGTNTAAGVYYGSFTSGSSTACTATNAEAATNYQPNGSAWK